MIHQHRRLIAASLTYHTRGNTRYGFTGGNILQNNRASSNPATVADRDITENLSAGPNQDPIADFRMTVLLFFTGAAQGNRMKHRHIIPHHGSLTDDH